MAAQSAEPVKLLEDRAAAPVSNRKVSTKTLDNIEKPTRLAERIADVISAGAATMLVAPIICLIDRSIIENASGRSKSVLASLGSSVKRFAGAPHRFFFSKPFALIYMTYFGTFWMANSIDTAASIRNGTDIKAATPSTDKFVATSGVNMGLGLIKDRNFARMFGTGSPRPVPLPSFVLFSARDAMTVFFSFNVPSLITLYMPQNFVMGPESCAQFLAPASCQLLSTPLHLLGLDLYNRGERAGWKERWKAVKSNWAPSAAARMCRIIPAFGFGGVTNTAMRRSLMKKIEQSA